MLAAVAKLPENILRLVKEKFNDYKERSSLIVLLFFRFRFYVCKLGKKAKDRIIFELHSKPLSKDTTLLYHTLASNTVTILNGLQIVDPIKSFKKKTSTSRGDNNWEDFHFFRREMKREKRFFCSFCF